MDGAGLPRGPAWHRGRPGQILGAAPVEDEVGEPTVVVLHVRHELRQSKGSAAVSGPRVAPPQRAVEDDGSRHVVDARHALETLFVSRAQVVRHTCARRRGFGVDGYRARPGPGEMHTAVQALELVR